MIIGVLYIFINLSKTMKKGGETMFKKLTNKLKMKNRKPANPGNVHTPGEFEVQERKKDVDENEK